MIVLYRMNQNYELCCANTEWCSEKKNNKISFSNTTIQNRTQSNIRLESISFFFLTFCGLNAFFLTNKLCKSAKGKWPLIWIFLFVEYEFACSCTVTSVAIRLCMMIAKKLGIFISSHQFTSCRTKDGRLFVFTCDENLDLLILQTQYIFQSYVHFMYLNIVQSS